MRALKYQNPNGEVVNTLAQAQESAKVVLEEIHEETKKPTKEEYAKITERIISGKARIK